MDYYALSRLPKFVNAYDNPPKCAKGNVLYEMLCDGNSIEQKYWRDKVVVCANSRKDKYSGKSVYNIMCEHVEALPSGTLFCGYSYNNCFKKLLVVRSKSDLEGYIPLDELGEKYFLETSAVVQAVGPGYWHCTKKFIKEEFVVDLGYLHGRLGGKVYDYVKNKLNYGKEFTKMRNVYEKLAKFPNCKVVDIYDQIRETCFGGTDVSPEILVELKLIMAGSVPEERCIGRYVLMDGKLPLNSSGEFFSGGKFRWLIKLRELMNMELSF